MVLKGKENSNERSAFYNAFRSCIGDLQRARRAGDELAEAWHKIYPEDK